ncbi:MAG: penicillin-binding transpeptidase domain-containing protein, partial [bacterium]|nr:penicillin-binding transpeptidase domain-containing protein [bacterium]
MFFVVFFRIIQIQFLFSPEFKKKEERQVFRKTVEPIKRGAIYDRNLKPLAYTGYGFNVEIYPYLLNRKSIMLLEKAINSYELEKIIKMVEKKESYYELKNFNEEVFVDVFNNEEAANYSGINIKIKPINRTYTLKDEYSGSINSNFKGITGIEYVYDDFLSNGFITVKYIKDGKGRVVRKKILNEYKNGFEGIVLTLDFYLQREIGLILSDLVKNTRPKRALIMVSDVNSGEVLACRWYNEVERYTFMPVSFVFEPGSVIKPFILYAFLKNGLKESDILYCEDGKWKVSDSIEINDVHPLKIATLRDIVNYSSNIGFGKLAMKLSDREIYEALKIFSFGDKLKDIRSAEYGRLVHYSKWGKYDKIFISFGQGIAVTPLQLSVAISAIANGGKVIEPKFVKGYIKNRIFYYEDSYVIREINDKDVIDRI